VTLAWIATVTATPVLRARLGGSWLTAPAFVAYEVGARICHQRADRSFATMGMPWPVCARCTGLYAGAAAGAALAVLFVSRRRGRAGIASRGIETYRAALVGAGLPTLVLWAAEWSGLAPVGNGLRFAAALPLGGLVAWVVALALGGNVE
jgi:uncharacterized membrane protein